MFKLLFMVLLAMCMLGGIAQAEDQYFVAIGEVDHAKADDPANKEAWTGHIANMARLYEQGKLVMAGPWENGEGGMILLKAASMEEAEALLHADPALSSGIIKPVALNAFHAFFSRPDNRTMTVEQFVAMMSAEPEMTMGSDGSQQDGGESGGMPEMTIGGVGFIAIPAVDAAASGAFYTQHFGWEVMPMDFGGMSMTFWNAPGGQMGEFNTMSRPAAPESGVTFYINTESVTAKVAALRAAGAAIVMEPMELPEGAGFIAQFTDPAGNVVGIWSAGK
jgi:predicted enzyme related to lactoylglutathione lyase/uncharacterized protein YciI